MYNMLLDALSDDLPQSGRLDGIDLDTLTLEALAAAVRLLRRPCRQPPLNDLLRLHRDGLIIVSRLFCTSLLFHSISLIHQWPLVTMVTMLPHL